MESKVLRILLWFMDYLKGLEATPIDSSLSVVKVSKSRSLALWTTLVVLFPYNMSGLSKMTELSLEAMTVCNLSLSYSMS